MSIRILGGRVIDPASGLDRVTDVYVSEGRISGIGHPPEGFRAEHTLDAQGLILAPGLVDVSAALCEPGFTRKGTIATETRAALAGGITSLCCTPNTRPVLDSTTVARLIADQVHAAQHTRVFPIGALSRALAGEQVAELVSLKEAGCVAFGNGLKEFENARNLRRALEYAATFDLTVVLHSQDQALAEGGLAHEGAVANFLGLSGVPTTAETVALARNLMLVEAAGVRAHFAQLSSAAGVAMIAAAQARGVPVTADVALYQLILTDEALHGFSSLYHVQPPLRTVQDREALREAVRSGVVSAIASHHQPHEPDAKLAPFGETEPGISSLDIFLPLALSLVQDGVLDLPTVLHRLTQGPAQALNLPVGSIQLNAPADLVLFSQEGTTLAGEPWYSKGRNSPFIGHCLPGVVHCTVVDGNIRHRANV